jgi:hypothetical protein
MRLSRTWAGRVLATFPSAAPSAAHCGRPLVSPGPSPGVTVLNKVIRERRLEVGAYPDPYSFVAVIRFVLALPRFGFSPIGHQSNGLDLVTAVEMYRDGVQSDNPVYLKRRERIIEDMRKAGVPEG